MGWERKGRESITCNERHIQLLCCLLVRSACETHERDPRVGLDRTTVENLCHTNDGTGEVDVACGLSVYRTVWLDLEENKKKMIASVRFPKTEYGRGEEKVRDASGSRPKRRPGR